MRRRSNFVLTLVLLVIGGGLAAGFLTGSSTGSADGATAWLAPTFSTSFTTDAGSWAIVPMGDLNDPFNTFWQAFFRTSPQSAWRLVTPPGVADNGGLSVETNGAQSDQVSIVFGPTNLLKFSPVATTGDNGANWSGGVVPFGTASSPDVFAQGTVTNGEVAALHSGGTVVEAGSLSGSQWSAVVYAKQIDDSDAGRPCGVGSITTLSGSPDDLFIGSSCNDRGVVGIFNYRSGGSIERIAPGLPSSDGSFSVLRLSATTAGLFALIDGKLKTENRLLALWMPSGGHDWAISPGLDITPHSRLVYAGIGSAGSAMIETQTNTGEDQAFSSTTGGVWMRLPTLPAGTQGLSESPDGQIDALCIHASIFDDWRLEGSTWLQVQHLDVPIQYGSSS
ncbi:MAG: hypothetical protein WAM97_15970 [Acidimicrobiales bacterium]